MFVSNMVALLSGPIVVLFTIFSLKKIGMDSLMHTISGKDRKLIPFALLIILPIILYSYTLLQEESAVGALEGWMMYVLSDNVYITAIYTFLFLVLPSCFIVWFILKKIYVRKNMSSAITVIHVITMLSLNRFVNYNYLDFDDAVFFWLLCYAVLMCYGMLEGGKSKKKMLMLAASVVALLAIMFVGSIDMMNIGVLGSVLLVENIVLFTIQNKFRIFRNIIRQGILLLVTIVFLVINLFI